MSVSPVMPHVNPRPTTVLLLRTPILPSQGTDPYHDAFGAFCLPSFPMSALDSGAATPIALPPKLVPEALSMTNQHSAESKHHQRHDGARPEELLLQALQQQQQRQQRRDDENERSAAAGDTRSKSPQRNYSRQHPMYATNEEQDPQQKQHAAAMTSLPGPIGVTPILTTHHISTQALTPEQAEGIGLSKTAGSSVQREWCVTSLSVIGSRSANQDELDELLTQGEWAGVVATSNRAWDVWKQAVIRCSAKGKQPATQYSSTPFFLISARAAATFRSTTLEDVPAAYAPSPTKVFGAPNTASTVKKQNKGSGDEDGGSGGAQGSAGGVLGEYITGWFERRRDPQPESSDEPVALSAKPLLLLQGDKALPALPSIFTQKNLPFSNIVVYETCADDSITKNLGRVSDLLRDLAWNERSGANSRRSSGASTGSNAAGGAKAFLAGAQMSSLRNEVIVSSPEEPEEHAQQKAIQAATAAQSATIANLARRPDWIVFFSPSGVDFAAEALRSRGWLPPVTQGSEYGQPLNSTDSSSTTYPHYLALGPTTLAHLRDRYALPQASGQETLSVAEKPEPSGVKAAILKAEAMGDVPSL